ncbi:MAG: hypothetical protein JST67_05740 [Bacteroidetes bacterium]|nr:hypothetical protein [Bacteroidota bacterium]
MRLKFVILLSFTAYISYAQKKCDISVFYDNKEYLKDSVTNYFIGLNNFNLMNKQCWNLLSEYYFNIVPDEQTKRQNTYFISIKDTSDTKITNISQILNSKSIQKQVIGVHEYGKGIKTYSFKKFPFRK